MSRRIVAQQKIFSAALVGAVLFLSFLPSLGWAWHRVLPEHAHWFIGALHDDSHIDAAVIAQNDCADCAPADSGTAIMHVPSFALQIVAISMGLPTGFSTLIPNGFRERVIPQSLNLSSLFLPLLDPPPKAV